MKERDLLQLCSIEQAAQAASLDADAVSTAKDKYVEYNTLTYYILINTWMLMIKQYAAYLWGTLLERILSKGLLPMIKETTSAADKVVNGKLSESPLAVALYREINAIGRPAGQLLNDELNIGRDPVATLLFLLRYPKRFSPLWADKIQAATLEDFLVYERRTKELQRFSSGRYSHDIGYSHFVLDLVRKEVQEMYNWEEICQEIDAINIDDIIFSSGAGLDSKASLGSKLMAIYKRHPEFFPTPFGVRMLDWPKAKEEEDRCSRVIAVPKSYKSARIVAMEDTYRLAYAKRVEMIFRDKDRRSTNPPIDLENQSINQDLAWEGSRTGAYATLDASHASDLISTSLFVEVFPWEYVKRVQPLISEYILIRDRKIRQHMLSTSGHSLTFRHETIVYKAIAKAASRLQCRMEGRCEDEAFAWAYGDDTIVYTHDVPIVSEFFANLGLIINQDKSFGEGTTYRESCGKEYYNGVEMTSLYYPRFPVLGEFHKTKVSLDSPIYHDEYRGKLDNSATMLIDLQKKLFPVSYPAARLVALVVKEAYPRMTFSRAGVECPDLWDYDDLGETRVPQAYGIGVEISNLHIYGDLEKPEVPGGSRTPALPWCMEIRRAVVKLDDVLVPEVVQDLAKLDTYHYAAYVAYEGATKYSDLEIRIWEMYKYKHFLKYGPSYSTPLDELLGISQAPMPLSQMFGMKRMAWRLQLI